MFDCQILDIIACSKIYQKHIFKLNTEIGPKLNYSDLISVDQVTKLWMLQSTLSSYTDISTQQQKKKVRNYEKK